MTVYDTDRASTDRKTDDDNDDGDDDGKWGAYDLHQVLEDEGWTDEDVAVWFTGEAKIWNDSEEQFEWQPIDEAAPGALGSAGGRSPFDSDTIAQGWAGMRDSYSDRSLAHTAAMEMLHTMVDDDLDPVKECSGAHDHDDDHGGEHSLGNAIYEYNDDYGAEGYYETPLGSGPDSWDEGACTAPVDSDDGDTFTLSECTKRAVEYTKQDRVPGLTLDSDDPPCGERGEFSGQLGGVLDRSATHTYTLDSDVDALEVSLSGPQSDDFDLFLTLDGRDPTRQDYDRVAQGANAEETITLTRSLQADQDIGLMVYAFSGAGQYHVSVEQNPGVGPAPQAAFATDTPTEGAPGETLAFDGSVSYDTDGSIESHEWRFGDGTTATGPTVEHSYDSPGTYTVELTVTDDDDQTDTAQRRLRIGDSNEPPVAQLEAPDTVTVGETAYINADSADDPDGTIERYRWELGDGTVEHGTSVSHTYRQAGEYTVRLTVTDADGATATAEHAVTVTDDNRAPTASIGGPDTLRSGEFGTFQAFDAEDPDGRIETIKWEMGDGTADTGRIVFHTYDSPGTYTVQLTVTDTDGAADTALHTVSVGNQEPVARLDAPDRAGMTESVTFDGSDSTDPDGGGLFSDGLEYDWDLGDSTSAAGQRVTHSYDGPGTYTVEVTVTDTDGATDTATHSISVVDDNEEPVARLDGPDTVQPGDSVVFDASDSNDPDGGGLFDDGLDYAWSLGDRHTGSGRRVSHSYGNPGTYTVSVTVTDEHGATDTAWHTITVENQTPVARIDAPDEVGLSESVTVDGSDSYDPDGGGFWDDGLDYDWDLGDWTDATGKRATHSYSSPGTYTVKLTVTDEDGATDSAWHTISVVDDNEEPVARIDAPREVGVGESATFDGSDSYDPDGGGWFSDGLDYDWDLGRWATDSGRRARHSFYSTGTYSVELTVTDEDGATDTAWHTISVVEDNEEPVARIDGPSTVEVDEQVTFDGSDSYDPDGGGFWSDGLDYDWELGHWTTDSGRRATHDFDSAGTHSVELTVTDEDGATDTARHTVTVEESEDDDDDGWWPFW